MRRGKAAQIERAREIAMFFSSFFFLLLCPSLREVRHNKGQRVYVCAQVY